MSSVHEESGENASLVVLSKGKRTKRQRSVSPLEEREEGEAGGEVEVREATNEVEEMANCLVLLSQGLTESSYKKQEGSSGLGLHGVYQCKTCDKCFPSHQALGGHMAGHKKFKFGESVLKIASEVETVEAAGAGRGFLSPQVTNGDGDGNRKGHECWICKDVLPSGQSLGGHMRKHRRFNPMSTSSRYHDEAYGRPKKMLQIDLNLPAPPEDESVFLPKEQILRFVAETKSFVASQSPIKYFM